MASHMKFSNLFITGCDKNTKWMLPWFQDNFYKHNPDSHLKVYNFDKFEPDIKGWFKKPAAMMDAAKLSNKVCWLDTDCEVRSNLQDIWSYTSSNRLSMVEDVPWSKRRGEIWHNSGVVLFKSYPNILSEWAEACKSNPQVGDQEVLHTLVKDGMRRMIHISDMPREYNTLRLDLLDKTEPKNIKIMHWTGRKGKEHIWSMIND